MGVAAHPGFPPGTGGWQALTHRELQERGHAGKELQDEGLAVQDVELAAGELDGLAQLGVALVVRVHLGTWKRAWRHHSSARTLHLLSPGCTNYSTAIPDRFV